VHLFVVYVARGRIRIGCSYFFQESGTLIWCGSEASSEAVKLFERRQIFGFDVLQFHF
jgi:hypothetical protein